MTFDMLITLSMAQSLAQSLNIGFGGVCGQTEHISTGQTFGDTYSKSERKERAKAIRLRC